MRGHPDRLPRGCASYSADHRGEGLVPGGVDRDRELEAGDFQHPSDLVVLAAEDEDAPVFAAVETLPGADDQSDPGGVDELTLREVDEDRALVVLERMVERSLEFRGSAEVELAAHGDRADALLEIPDLYLERGWSHGSMLPQDGKSLLGCFAPLWQG